MTNEPEAIPFDETTGRWADDPVVSKPLAPQINREFSDCGPAGGVGVSVTPFTHQHVLNFPKFSFSDALAVLKSGGCVQRDGWNGKGMFLYLVPANSYPAQTGAAKRYWGEDALVPYGAYIAMKTAQENVVPWLASQTDILADDWRIV